MISRREAHEPLSVLGFFLHRLQRLGSQHFHALSASLPGNIVKIAYVSNHIHEEVLVLGSWWNMQRVCLAQFMCQLKQQSCLWRSHTFFISPLPYKNRLWDLKRSRFWAAVDSGLLFSIAVSFLKSCLVFKHGSFSFIHLPRHHPANDRPSTLAHQETHSRVCDGIPGSAHK